MKFLLLLFFIKTCCFAAFELDNKYTICPVNAVENATSWGKFDVTAKEVSGGKVLQIIPGFELKVEKEGNDNFALVWNMPGVPKDILFGSEVKFKKFKDFYESEAVKDGATSVKIKVMAKRLPRNRREKLLKSLLELQSDEVFALRRFDFSDKNGKTSFLKSYGDKTLSSFLLLSLYEKSFLASNDCGTLRMVIEARLRNNSSPMRFDDVTASNIKFDGNNFSGDATLDFGELVFPDEKAMMKIKCEFSGKFSKGTVISVNMKMIVNDVLAMNYTK